ncbi:MAG TPA: hypothetical protein VMS55_11515 [Myxococcota bacterium]|nr:hypothetical protein [Myxococcota bacterium]
MKAEPRSAWLALAAFACVAAAMAIAAGQPVFTDDLWWHLGLGEAYAQHGPWLHDDPLLFTAPGPPDASAWLSDAALFAVWKHAGFTGLRALHAAIVASLIALAFSLARRGSDSRAVAAAVGVAFVALAAYRLVQLRPELFSIGAALGLYALWGNGAERASWRRIAATALLFAVWANCHAAFPLGLALLAASAAAELAASVLAPPPLRAASRARGARLAIAFFAGLLASFANPTGAAAYQAWLRAGESTPELARVADEWARFEPWHIPVANLPPSPLAWALAIALLASSPWLALRALRRTRDASPPAGVGPAAVAVSLVSLAALLTAVRFLWLGVFPLLALARATRGRIRTGWMSLAAVVLAAAFFPLGDWPMVSNAMPRSAAGYAEPYNAAKYYAHAIWFLEDAQLEGQVFTDYPIGGFVGFFGAPRLRAFVNGSLNVTRDAIDANRPLREGRGARPGETFLALLDRMQIDLYVGTRLPEPGPAGRPWFYTTALLEGAPGWLQVFRNADSAVYLRTNERNQANLARVADYYAREHVPFDPARGFEPESAIRAARLFAVTHGIVPVHFEDLAASAHTGPAAARRAAAGALASVYACLGLYERALRLDRATLEGDPTALSARRRMVWSLLRLGRFDEAQREAAALLEAAGDDALSQRIARTASDIASLDDEARAARIATLPVFTPVEAQQAMAGMALPEVRTQRARDDQIGSSASATPSST